MFGNESLKQHEMPQFVSQTPVLTAWKFIELYRFWNWFILVRDVFTYLQKLSFFSYWDKVYKVFFFFSENKKYH